VTAPSESPSSATSGRSSLSSASIPGEPASCSQSWRLEDVTEPGVQVIVACAADVRREHVQGSMVRALDPGLAAAHDRVCACAARIAVPTAVSLQVTAVPEDGRARVEATEPDPATDGEEAPGFAGCVGAFDATFDKFSAGACEGGKTTYIYVLDVELAR
jgi:hypothetical protein